MGAADKIAFVFTRPGKSPKDSPKPKDDGDGYDREDKRDESEDSDKPTRKELGLALADAVEARDGEAICEAVLKIVDLGPDAE